MRAVSQRVVNVSNETAEAAMDRRMRRKSSVRQPRPSDLERMPSFPEYGVDGATPFQDQPEKRPSFVDERPDEVERPIPTNPLKGKSLGVFSADSRIRIWLCDVMVHPAFEISVFFIILLQLILLTIDASTSVYDHPRSRGWGHSWIDFATFGIFIVYTVEMIIRVIVSGFFINPREYSTINRSIGFGKAVRMKFNSLFALEHEKDRKSINAGAHQPAFGTFGTTQPHPDFVGNSKQQARQRLAYRAYLRHSFNRLDFLAVIAFWISFVLDITGLEQSKHAYIFRMLSCLRIIRLLAATSGMSIILRSLKKSAPMLINVAILIGFFWLLFAIIGLQAFKSSLRRECVWVDPEGIQENFTNSFQFCGGHLNAQAQPVPWLYPDGRNGSTNHKGFLCPINSLCIQGENPYNGTVSFDNIFQSLELVFVIMSSNTFSDLLYYLTDSDYLVAATFFAAGIVILYFWLVNLLIAVITSSFQVIREESRTSAFTGEEKDTMSEEEPEDDGGLRRSKKSQLKALYDKSKYLWVVLIAFDTVVMCLRSATMGPQRTNFINTTETVVTIILFIEIVIRWAVDFRHFLKSKQNVTDLILALATLIIQIPQIHNSGQVYAWLTIFQIARLYRVVLATPFTRDLVVSFLRHSTELTPLTTCIGESVGQHVRSTQPDHVRVCSELACCDICVANVPR